MSKHLSILTIIVCIYSVTGYPHEPNYLSKMEYFHNKKSRLLKSPQFKSRTLSMTNEFGRAATSTDDSYDHPATHLEPIKHSNNYHEYGKNKQEASTIIKFDQIMLNEIHQYNPQMNDPMFDQFKAFYNLFQKQLFHPSNSNEFETSFKFLQNQQDPLMDALKMKYKNLKYHPLMTKLIQHAIRMKVEVILNFYSYSPDRRQASVDESRDSNKVDVEAERAIDVDISTDSFRQLLRGNDGILVELFKASGNAVYTGEEQQIMDTMTKLCEIILQERYESTLSAGARFLYKEMRAIAVEKGFIPSTNALENTEVTQSVYPKMAEYRLVLFDDKFLENYKSELTEHHNYVNDLVDFCQLLDQPLLQQLPFLDKNLSLKGKAVLYILSRMRNLKTFPDSSDTKQTHVQSIIKRALMAMYITKSKYNLAIGKALKRADVVDAFFEDGPMDEQMKEYYLGSTTQ